MPLDLPDNAQEVDTRFKTDVQRSIPESNPFLKNSVIAALITGLSNRVFDFYVQLRQLIDVLFIDTATGTFLERWASIWGKTRLGASKATGSVVATGTATAVIPLGTVFASSDGSLYDATVAGVIAVNILAVTSITRVGNTATVTTTNDHNLSSNVSVTHAGAGESDYNITAPIIVTGLDTYTYTVAGSPTTPATGTITSTSTTAIVAIESQAFGAAENLEANELVNLQSPIVNVDSELGVSFGAIGGGTDQESDDQLRGRTQDRLQNPVAHFNVSDITEKAKEVPGVTRVFVEEVTPDFGQVTVYFMRDNDTPAIPDASEVTTVKDKLLTIKPANTATADLIVNAPVAVVTPFTFSALTPNSPSMQSAINANLAQFFAEETTVGVNVDEDAYRSVIINTTDLDTGLQVSTFALSTPTSDITIASGEIATLGVVTYP